MEPNDTDKPDEQYFEHGMENLRQFDLSPITERVAKKRNVEDAAALEKKFKRFAMMYLEDPDTGIAPSEELDEYWHEFILDTKRYEEFCDHVFGYFVHHMPTE